MIGKMNWANLLDYTVQPSDLELFQSYVVDNAKLLMNGSRTKGIVFGGQISIVSGMQIRVSAGLAIMPDGQLVQFPQTDLTIDGGDTSNPRIDRIELGYSITNNTQVFDVNSQAKYLDQLYSSSISKLVGTPALSPSAPAATATKISIGLITVPANASALVLGNIGQVVDSGFETSAIQLGNKNSFIRYNQTLAKLQFSHDGSVWQVFGSGAGGGGGGGANWQPVDGLAPLSDIEYNERVFKFSQGEGQALSLWIKVPAGYLAGGPVVMKMGHYSPATSNNFKFQTLATLIKKNTDAVSSTTNQYTSTNSDVSNSVANQYREVSYDLTNGTGQINGVPVAAGDLINVQISRVTPVGTEDSSDVRLIPSSTEVSFS